ncbi:LytTR family DNA-binding domain-containing protein [Niameybacter massiliensis]|uniref:Stage 0 sporulation protein A homolog n=1 Tax=Holtiella tumoricola TaxID=3018743 RepID=A0AA42J064_9FIRM|nr:LytTR family DNA-binding domain-containing protein [Holtiella tumoricola]MDA3731147.1 LytTR family DNA-binding domain-containing protein [Holtiella tumoricola]
MDIKVLLIEDEAGIRLLMRKIIEKTPGFIVVGECEEGKEGLRVFNKLKPDVVFLDIQLKEGSGLDCAKEIADIEPKTKIIFATAHCEYMPEAFSVYAFDYLVKPFNVERVTHTLERIKALQEPDQATSMDKIVRYEKGLEKLLVKGKESMSFVNINDIILVQREDSNTVIYTQKDAFTTSASLTEVEEKLDPDQFIRSHKSYIINLSQITKISPYGRWTYIVKFKDLDKDALITGEKYEEIKKMFL